MEYGSDTTIIVALLTSVIVVKKKMKVCEWVKVKI